MRQVTQGLFTQDYLPRTMSKAPEFNLPGLNAYFSHQQNDFRISKPFGPNILETRLPESVYTSLLSLSSALLGDNQRRSYGPHLVGQIREEPEIPLGLLDEYGVLDYIRGMFAEYVLASVYCDADDAYKEAVAEFQAGSDYRNPVRIDVEAAWLVSQQAGEYNPIHNHSQSTLSSVLYLQVPENLDESPLPGKTSVDGCIEWVNESAQPLHNSTVRLTPRPRMFYIFPASLLHLVYPFKGSQERRSISINATHEF